MHMKQMKKKTAFIASIICTACVASNAGGPKIDHAPLEIGTAIDIGQIVSGADDGVTGDPTDAQMIQRTAVYLNQLTTVNDRLLIKVGVGGLFFFGSPESRNDAASRAIRFGPGVGQAQGIYKFGDLENPSWTLQFGYFPYKYNPDAKNLGEYLLRSGGYPGYEVTGGWSIMNSALYMASGLRIHGSFLSGKLSADLNIFMERDIEPIYDISPSLLATYKPVSMVEMGAGAEFAHAIPVIPSKLKSNSAYYNDTSVTDNPNDKTYTFQAVKLMGRASVNFGTLLNNPWVGPEGLKLYSEVAVLGVEDYFYYYNNILQRIPVLVGLNLPTLKFFDVLAIEGEYRNWPFPNNTEDVAKYANPLYVIPGGLEWNQYNPRNHPDSVFSSKANYKWTVYAKKRLIQGVTLYAQVASDYLRGIRWEDNTLTRETVTQQYNQWYYIMRLEFGI